MQQQSKASTSLKLFAVLALIFGIPLVIYLISRFLGGLIPQMAFIAPIVDEKILWFVGTFQGLSNQYGSLLTLGIGTLSAGLVKAVSMIVSTRKTVTDTKTQLSSAQTSLKQTSSSLSQISEEKQKLTDSFSSIQEQAKALGDEKTMLVSEVSSLKDEKTQMADQIKQLEAVNTNNTQLLANNAEEIKRLSSFLEAAGIKVQETNRGTQG